MYDHVTLCFSLPRSRSQWLAWVYGRAITTWHDPLGHLDTPLGLKARIDSERPRRLFVADTGAILYHDAIVESLPGARRMYVLRDPVDVCASLKRQTGYTRAKLIETMYLRLVDRACGWTCEYPAVDRLAEYCWGPVTGQEDMTADWWRKAGRTVIDIPVLYQQVDEDARRRLMTYRET